MQKTYRKYTKAKVDKWISLIKNDRQKNSAIAEFSILELPQSLYLLP